MGRPKLPAKERREHRIALALTADEYKILSQAADRDERELAVFARRTLLETLSRRRK